MPGGDQGVGEVRADEAATAGDQEMRHAAFFFSDGRW
jgi:hypothetical protein